MKNWKRYLSVAMTLVMLLGVLPTAAFAETIALTEENVTIEPATYSGEVQTPVVKINGVTATQGTDYSFAVVGSVELRDAGTYSLTIIGAGNYTGTVTKSFNINPKPISELTVTVASDAQTYDGNQKTPGVTVKHGETELTKDTHYTVAYGDNINAGENAGTVTITAKTGTNYTGSTTVNFTIQPMTVSTDDVAVSIPDVTYGQTPAPTVTYKGAKLASTEYEVTYSGTNADSQTATVRLKGNYAGTKTQRFTINPKALTAPSIEEIASQTYTGRAIEPAVVVKDGEAVIPSSQYTVSYANNTNAGTATVSVTFSSNYTYTGDPVTKTFTISRKDISAAVLGGLNTTYNPGSRPVPTVTLDGETLVEGNDKDYTLSYDETTTSGSLIITVTGRGNYTGSKQATVAVLGTSDTTAPAISGVTNGGTYYEAKTITVTDFNLEKVEIYEGTTLKNTLTPAKGTTTVSAVLELSDTTYGIKAYDKVGNKTEFTVTVTKKSITSAMITIAGADNIVYDGTAKTPTITVKDGSTTIAADQYTLSWENNTNAGTATVKVTMNSNAAYKGEASKTFTIKPKALTSSAIQEIDDQTYTGNPIEPTITVKDGDSKTLEKGSDKDYTVAYSNNINPGTAKVTVVLRGNYTGTLEKTFTIGQDLSALENNIKTLAAKTTLTYAEKQQIKQLKAAYDALSASEKATVDREVGSALMTSFKNKASAAAFKLLNKPSVDYYKYVKGTSSNVVIQIDADYSRTHVTEIRMGKNLTVIDPANYTVTEGSVVVTLSSTYLKQIKDAGKYNLYIDLMDTQTGHTETVQTVVRVVPATDIPQTGDPFRMNLWIGLLGASVLALAGLGVYEVVKKKKNAQKRLEAAMELGEEPSDEASTDE